MMQKVKTFVKKAQTAGQALVEFALAATLIFFLLSAAVDLGMIFFAMQGLHNAAQEGALYGSAMAFNDEIDKNGDGKIAGKKERDTDGDGVIQRDIFNDQAGDFFPEFLDEVRKRASYEAGTRGGIGFISLRDLDSDGDFDDVETLREFVQVSIIKTNVLPDEPCGNPTNTNCTIKVKVMTDYRIQFPLAPALPKDKIRLASEFSVELNKTGFTRFGKPNTDPITATLTPTPSPSVSPSVTPTTTPTKVPPVACKGFLSGSDIIASPWSEKTIGTAEGVGSANAGIENSTIKMCGAAFQTFGLDDNLYYLYTERTDPANSYQEFTAKITDWERPGIDDTTGLGYTNQDATKAGLMIRKSALAGAPLAFVGYRPLGNKVIFQYRSQQIGGGDDKVKNFSQFVDASNPPVWFRLRRLGTQVKAWYSTDDPPKWQLLTGENGDEWATVEGFTAGDSLVYGTALISGYTPNSSLVDEYPHQFGKAIFSDVAIETEDLGLSVNFIRPTDSQAIGSLEDMAFESEIFIDSKDVKAVDVKYWIETPEGETLVILSPGAGDDNECYFGGKAGACNQITPEQYALLTGRGPSYRYRAWVRVEFNDPQKTVLADSVYFTLQDLQIDFVIPATNGWTLSNADQTNFQITAHDPTVGTEAGNGISRSVFWVEYTPLGSSSGQRIFYLDTERESRTSDLMCVFGGEAGTNNSCDTMPTEVGEGWSMTFPIPSPPPVTPPNYNRLQAGNYIVFAQVQTESGAWSAQVSRQFSVAAPEYMWVVPDEDSKEIATHDESAFEVKAWMPHIGSENGAGIGSIAFQVLEGDDPSKATNAVLYSNEDTIESTGEPFCTFSEQADKTCQPMPADDPNLPNFDYYKLPSGTYTIRLMVLYDGQKADWSSWRKIDQDGKPHNYRRFVIPELPVYLDFVYDTNDDELPNHLGYITDRESQTKFRVKAFAGDKTQVEKKTGTDGTNIELIEFELLDMQGEVMELDATEDKDVRYCFFGGNSPCDPMDSTMFDEKMQSETPYHDQSYTIRARAKTTLNGGRWTEWEERTFAIPPVKMRFADPDPLPHEDDNNYPEEPDDYYQDDNRKVVREEEQTRFEIEAFDPKYLNQLGDKADKELYDNVYDPSLSDEEELDTLFEQYNGIGIDRYDVRFCGPDSSSECKESEELDDPALSITQEYEWNDDGQTGPGARMCVFGYDADDDECQITDDYNLIPRGEYIIKTRVANKITENSGWSYWDQTEWVDITFDIPKVAMAFMNVPVGNFTGQVLNRESYTRFGLYAYDPKYATIVDGKFENGGFNAPIEVFYTIVGPAPLNTVVYSRTVTLPEYGATENYCVFGGTNSSCEPMSADLYSKIPAGDYTLRASIMTSDDENDDGFNDYYEQSDTFTMPYANVTVQFASTYTETYYLDDLKDEAAAFEIRAYTTGLTPLENGQGVTKVEFTLVGVDAKGLSFPVLGVFGKNTSIQEDTTAPYCPFGTSTDQTCASMTTTMKKTLADAGGVYYVLQVRAQQNAADGSRWSALQQVKIILVP